MRLALTTTCALALAACAGSSATPDTDRADLAACTGAACVGLCIADADCAAGRRCDLRQHLCVDCLADEQCAAGERCEPTSGACVRGCSAARGCGDGGVCEADAGLCLECGRDDACRDPRLPRCETRRHRCVPCLPAGNGAPDNCAAGSFCSDAGGQLACAPGCKADRDCAALADAGARGERCDLATHQCVACIADEDCADGHVCKAGRCESGCSAKRPCAGGLLCCNGACSDVAGDAQNCGGCGSACQGGWTCCHSSCVNPTDDLMNCGGCGLTCNVQNGTPACVGRACAVGGCNAGWDDCNGVVRDGCETHTDVNPINCGACGNFCVTPHALAACSGGQCAIDTCLGLWADCNRQAGDGCEVDTHADVKNCGDCGIACGASHATPACTRGVCSLAACDFGFADCNRVEKDGCEVGLFDDPRNCGACGSACSNNHIANPGCGVGLCNGACDPGFGDCNGNKLTDGCELPLSGDNDNCGRCGNVCAQNTTCVNGQCVAPMHGMQEYTTPGSYTFTVPQGVTSLVGLAIGGGGSGNKSGGGTSGGGGGGAKSRVAVTPGQTISVVVGAGGGCKFNNSLDGAASTIGAPFSINAGGGSGDGPGGIGVGGNLHNSAGGSKNGNANGQKIGGDPNETGDAGGVGAALNGFGGNGAGAGLGRGGGGGGQNAAGYGGSGSGASGGVSGFRGGSQGEDGQGPDGGKTGTANDNTIYAQRGGAHTYYNGGGGGAYGGGGGGNDGSGIGGCDAKSTGLLLGGDGGGGYVRFDW